MAHWFINNLDTKLYSDKFKDENKQIKLNPIKYRNHIYTPNWKTFKFLTFGAILTVFKALKANNLKQ